MRIKYAYFPSPQPMPQVYFSFRITIIHINPNITHKSYCAISLFSYRVTNRSDKSYCYDSAELFSHNIKFNVNFCCLIKYLIG